MLGPSELGSNNPGGPNTLYLRALTLKNISGYGRSIFWNKAPQRWTAWTHESTGIDSAGIQVSSFLLSVAALEPKQSKSRKADSIPPLPFETLQIPSNLGSKPLKILCVCGGGVVQERHQEGSQTEMVFWKS